MKKYLSTLGTFAFVFAAFFDNQLNITGRLNDGTLLPRVRAIQTITINGKQFTSEAAVEKNMTHLRHLSLCSVTPEKCKAENVTW